MAIKWQKMVSNGVNKFELPRQRLICIYTRDTLFEHNFMVQLHCIDEIVWYTI